VLEKKKKKPDTSPYPQLRLLLSYIPSHLRANLLLLPSLTPAVTSQSGPLTLSLSLSLSSSSIRFSVNTNAERERKGGRILKTAVPIASYVHSLCCDSPRCCCTACTCVTQHKHNNKRRGRTKPVTDQATRRRESHCHTVSSLLLTSHPLLLLFSERVEQSVRHRGK